MGLLISFLHTYMQKYVHAYTERDRERQTDRALSSCRFISQPFFSPAHAPTAPALLSHLPFILQDLASLSCYLNSAPIVFPSEWSQRLPNFPCGLALHSKLPSAAPRDHFQNPTLWLSISGGDGVAFRAAALILSSLHQAASLRYLWSSEVPLCPVFPETGECLLRDLAKLRLFPLWKLAWGLLWATLLEAFFLALCYTRFLCS